MFFTVLDYITLLTKGVQFNLINGRYRGREGFEMVDAAEQAMS